MATYTPAQYAEKQLYAQLQSGLSGALTQAFGAGLPPGAADQFAAAFARPVAHELAEGTVQSIGDASTTGTFLAFGLAMELLSLVLLYPRLRENPRSVRNWLLFIAIIMGVINLSVIIQFAKALTAPSFPLLYALATIPTIAIVANISSALWNSTELWQPRNKNMFRAASILFALVYAVIQVYLSCTGFSDCPDSKYIAV